MINTNDIAEKEIETYSEILLNFTKSAVECKTKVLKVVLSKTVREVWQLLKVSRHMASVNAFNDFFNLTGLDIRDYNWFSEVKDKKGNKFKVHNLFQDEHMTTVFDFVNNLIFLYEKGELTKEKVKQLILKQRMCWITKNEDKILTKNGYQKHRQDPLAAYKESGIEIFEANKENLSDVMKAEFVRVSSKNAGIFNGSNDNIRKEFFGKLKTYFENNLVNGSRYKLTVTNSAHSYICNSVLMVNVRVNSGLLDDVCAFIQGDNAKQIFDILIEDKESIEREMGYKLVWDRLDNRKAVRIGRFGKYSTKVNHYDFNDDDDVFDGEDIELYDFDLNVEKVANELDRFYKVFMPRVKKIIANLKS